MTGNPMGRDELRDIVIRLEQNSEHISKSVDKLADLMKDHVTKTSDDVRAIHARIEAHKDNVGEKLEKYITKEDHEKQARPMRYTVKTMAAALVAFALAAVNYVIFGKH